MATPSPATIITLLAFVPLVIGILLVVRSRGTGRHAYPTCGGCAYDVTGSLGTVTRCPECGADFAAVGIRPRGTAVRSRERRAGVVLLIATPILLAATLLPLRAAMVAQERAQAARARAQAVLAQSRAAAVADDTSAGRGSDASLNQARTDESRSDGSRSAEGD